MIIPSYLKPGDKIGIISTASKIDAKIIYSAAQLLKEKGFIVELGKSIFAQKNQFAGTDEQRRYDLQWMLDSTEVKAIICSRGGYGTLRTIENINWNSFLANPKWIIGFSDVTVLHSKLNLLNVSSIHGVMPRYFHINNEPTESFLTLLNAINGNNIVYEFEYSKYNKTGNTEGVLIGGNLSILYGLRGTNLDMDAKDKILFIEDLSEYLYHLDRMMMNIKIGDKLKNLKGLLVGSFSNMKDNDTPYGKNVEEIILNAVENYNFPVAFNFPAGHQQNNVAIKLGCMAKLNVDSEKSVLYQMNFRMIEKN